MNTANYLKNGKYPLSTETLSFIQDQIKLLEALAGLGGKTISYSRTAGSVVSQS